MSGTAFRFTVLGAALVGAVLGGLWLALLDSDPRGVPPAALVAAASRTQTLVSMAVLLVGATALGCLVGRLVNAVVGLFVLGAAISVYAMRTGPLSGLVFDAVPMSAIGIETCIWAVVMSACAMVVFLMSGPLPDVPREERVSMWRELAHGDALRALAPAVLAVPVIWVVARSGTKGQAIGAAVLAGMVCGAGSRMAAPRVQPILIFGAPLLALGIAQVASGARLGAAPDALLAAGALSPLLHVLPVDAAGGIVVGVAMGLGWARGTAKPAGATLPA
jgi:hypothetical protein